MRQVRAAYRRCATEYGLTLRLWYNGGITSH